MCEGLTSERGYVAEGRCLIGQVHAPGQVSGPKEVVEEGEQSLLVLDSPPVKTEVPRCLLKHYPRLKAPSILPR